MGMWKCLFAVVESFKVQQVKGDIAREPQTYFRSSLLSLWKIKAGETRLEKNRMLLQAKGDSVYKEIDAEAGSDVTSSC